MEESMINANKNAPHVYQCIINKFYKKFGHLKMAKPVTIEQISTIVINNDNDNTESVTNTNVDKEVAAKVIQDKWRTRSASISGSNIVRTRNLISSELESHISHKKTQFNPSYQYEIQRLNEELDDTYSENKNQKILKLMCN